jgi:hypothetical protein
MALSLTLSVSAALQLLHPTHAQSIAKAAERNSASFYSNPSCVWPHLSLQPGTACSCWYRST